MAASGGSALDTLLSKEEIDSIPEPVYGKIKVFVEENFEEYLTSKALFESSKAKHEHKSSELERELEECKNAHAEDKRALAVALEELESFKQKYTEAQNELTTLRESVRRLEYENNDFRRQRNDAVDERDSLIKMVDRRTAEVERLESDVKRLTGELASAINAKCEALAAAEDVKSRQAALAFKEDTIKKEKEFLNKKIQNLTEELNKYEMDIANLRRDHAKRLVTLQTSLAEKTEELRIAATKDEQLTATNLELTSRIETLATKLMGMRESESTMADNYQQELQAKTKLADLYKRMVEDSNSKIEELSEAVQGLQHLLQEAGRHYDEAEQKRLEEAAKHKEILEAKNKCIATLKTELKDANELIQAVKQETIEQTVEGLSPAAAAASKLLKSGLTLTQIYTQHVAMGEELMMEREENRKLNQCINAIFEELEEKAPLLQKQRENYDNAVESVTALCKQNDELVEECRQLRGELLELKKTAGDHDREKSRLRQELKDLSRQVCFLLKEVEEARGGVISMEEDTSLNTSLGASDVISKRLVTFRDVEDLQAKNQQLLAIVHVLSAKQEELEHTQKDLDIPTLQENIKCLTNEVTNLRESANQQKMMLDQVVRQRDTYRDMYERTAKGEQALIHQELKERSGDEPVVAVASPIKKPVQPPPSPSVLASKDRQIQELEKRIATHEKQLKDVKQEYEEYRKERRTNEQMLTDQVDSSLTRIRELTIENSKLATQAEFQTERFSALKSSLSSQKAQITALEEKCANYSATIAKHEQSVKQLMDEALNAQTKLSRVEVEAESLREEVRLLRDAEARLRREKESRERETTTQTVLMASLESIKTALDRSETEGRLRLEQRLDESTRECTALRRRLQEEQEHFRELAAHLERQTSAAVARQEEERSIAEQARAELITVRQELQKKSAHVEQLEAKAREVARTPPVVIQKKDDQLVVRVRQLESKLTLAENQVKSLEQQLNKANDHSRQFSSIAESTEKQLQEMSALHKKQIDELENRLKVAQANENQLRQKTAELELRVSELQAVGNQSVTDLQKRAAEVEAQLEEVKGEKNLLQEERDALRKRLDDIVSELQSATDARKEAEEKYAREVVLHSSDIQALEASKAELSQLASQVAELRSARQHAEEALALRQQKFEEQDKLRAQQLEESKQELADLAAQNSLLHDQLQALGTQLSIFQSKLESTPVKTAASPAAGGSAAEEFRGSAQLLEVVKFLRRENELSVTRLEALNAENARLRSEQEIANQQLAALRENVQQLQREKDTETVTSSRHQELLRKVETLNAITDSNRVLREERDSLREKERQLSQKVNELELKLAPLEEQNRALVSQADSSRAENVALKEDINRWRKRTSALIERANKTSPEDWKRLQNERESLARQLTAERDAHAKNQEETRSLKQEKAKLEEQNSNATRRLAQLETELRTALENSQKQTEDLNALKTRVTSLESDLAEQQALQTKLTEDVKRLEEENASVSEKEAAVRRIARRYKCQHDELVKKNEEMRKLTEKQAEATASGSVLLSADAQEQLREEGRREAEQKLQDAITSHGEQMREAEQRLKDQESSHNEKLREVTSQVSSSKEEIDTLRQENEHLHQAEEQLRTLMKNARMKLAVLSDDKAALEQQLKDANQRHLKDAEENKKRFSSMKSQFEGKLARLEKEKSEALSERGDRERLQRELDTMAARCSLLQRQLDKQSGKPSASAGHSDKGPTDPPPTANIKPMAGQSVTANKQQTQQAATVTPWRGGNETPHVASVRPMSMQSRRVAVLPQTTSSQQPSGSTAVLAPLHQQQNQPQQQVPTSQPQSQSPLQQQAVQPQQQSQQQQPPPQQQQQQQVQSLQHPAQPQQQQQVQPLLHMASQQQVQQTLQIAPTAPQLQPKVAVLQPGPQTQQLQPQQQAVPQQQLQQQSPAQQAVHTTGPTATGNTSTSAAGSMEATSSHTDYMPATSSATLIRQAAIPPTQQSSVGPSTTRDESGAESTQDMDIDAGENRAGMVSIASVPQVVQPSAQQAVPTHPNQAGSATMQHQVQASQQQAAKQVQPSVPQAQQQVQQQQQQAQQLQPPQRSVGQQQVQQHAVAMVLPRERSEHQAQVQQVQLVPQAPSVQQQSQPPQQQQAQSQQQQQAQQQQQSLPQAGAVPTAQGEPAQNQQVQQAGATAAIVAAVVASSQQASSSSTVTTSQSGSQVGLKRPRDSEGEASLGRPTHAEPGKAVPQVKRSRRCVVVASGSGAPGEPFQAVESSDCGRLEVEYQVPTSSQRDQEDDIIVVTDEDEDDEEEEEDEPADEEDDEDVGGMADDGLAEDGSADEGGMELEDNDGYAMEAYDRDDQANYDDGEGPDIDDVNAGGSNEVEIIEDSNEVPSQTGSSTGRSDPSQAVGSSASTLSEQMAPMSARRSPQQAALPQPQQPQQPQQGADHQQQILQQQLIQQQSSSSEATSSGVVNQSDNGSSSGSGNGSGVTAVGSGGGNNQVSSQGLAYLGRGRTSNRQQQLLLPQGYEGDTSDDCIVPSTPTLFVPRRTDGFGEAVSSPQVPSAGRFTFSESNPPTARAGVAQVVCEGMDDTRMDLSQLEEPGTGRSVPTTPLQVSPQGENVGGELAGEVGESGSAVPSGESSGIAAAAVNEASQGTAGPSIPTITVTGTDQQPRLDQGNLELELDAEQRELGAEEAAEEPEEVLILDVEDENGDGVSSEGQKLGQPLRPLAEEGREAEASRPTASSPQGSPYGSGSSGGETPARGGQTARRSARVGVFARRGRGTNRPKPIVWNEPGSSSTSPRGGSSSNLDLLSRGTIMGRGMMQNLAFPPRGQRARRMRKSGFKNPFSQGPF